MSEKTLEQIICEQVVCDYFTPNIKAEVILDALLTPRIQDIIEEQSDVIWKKTGERIGSLTFLTKEMSIPVEKFKGNRGPKIDYVLADKARRKIYLVELKTANVSIKNEQAAIYRKYCHNKYFGDVLGKRLLSILIEKFNLKTDGWTDEPLWQAWELIWERQKQNGQACGGCPEPPQCAEQAKRLIRINGWNRSKKYLYTLGQLLDCDAQDLWNAQMVVLYLTPNGDGSKGFPCLSLKRYADSHTDSSDPYTKMLSDILMSLYGGGDGNA